MTSPAERPSDSHEAAAIARLIDANLDRSREGLRVLEDWARFGLDRADLVARTKDLRQRLGRLHRQRYKLARHTATDPAAGLGHPAQLDRSTASDVVAANAARVQEALRVLEEYGRLQDPLLATEAAQIRYQLYDLEIELITMTSTGEQRRRLLHSCRLYLITGPDGDLEATVSAALQAGVRRVQYRAKDDGGGGVDDCRRLKEGLALRRLCHRHGALLIINDRVDLALAVDADGVHLGQGDLPPAIARRMLGPERLIGRSTHAIDQLRQAVTEGCDYAGVGPVNATPTKPGRSPVGLDYVRQASGETAIPWFAIGGIDADTLHAVRRAGAQRVAVVRAICDAPDPGQAAARLLSMLSSLVEPSR